MKKFVVALVFLAFALPLCAETPDSVPNPLRTQRSWVSDVARAISDADTLAINRTVEELQKRTSAEIAVVTVQNSGGDTPKEFATALFNKWGVGKKGKDNGVLVLMVMGQRRVEVETGYGVEGDLPDGKVGEILREQAVPHFKQGDYGAGLLAVVQEFAGILSNGTVAAPRSVAPVRTPAPSHRSVVPHVGSSGAPHNAAPSYAPPMRESPPSFSSNYTVTTSSGPFDWIYGLLILMTLPLGGGALLWVIFNLVKNLNTRHCPQCNGAMRYLTEQEDDAFLDEGQVLEERLGGLDWRVWRCDACNVQHIERSVKFLGGYEDCPRCAHHTVQFSSATLRMATEYSEGVREVTRVCHFPDCGYEQRSQETIPRDIPTPVYVSSSSSSDFGSSSSGSSSSDTSFSSSSSDFGGGSSGGGGAGADW